MKDKILALFYEGKSYREIKEQLGCSKGTISYHLSPLRNFSIDELRKQVECKCEECGKNYFLNKSKAIKNKFCSKSCQRSNWNRFNKDILSMAGRKSVKIQGDSRRSKNEIYFFELCDKNFSNVTNNEMFFNGWDADVILHDFKLAVLWNGAWHYKKICKKHNIDQVQNRDRIKKQEIIKMGYTPYTIKDLGKFNKDFVKQEFDKLNQFITQNFK